ncbi:unnamed protein product [Clonostachys rosea]|uniref:Zn(2)-C6 fungal-type domain-containing protein n=1 Tax=Bionectria ochroleuca TaxID=29856 RepID=A0ABY6UW41_BIOOC|nr:unnamed protein product [Clonostachys rosea]
MASSLLQEISGSHAKCCEPLSDLLKRHLLVHSSEPAPTARTSQACDACHESKTKCDGGEQCSLCTKRAIQCTYSRLKPPKRKANFDDGDLTAIDLTNGIRDGDIPQSNQQHGTSGNSNIASGIAKDLPGPGASEINNDKAMLVDTSLDNTTRNEAAKTGLRFIHQLVSAASAGQDPPNQPQSSHHKTWISDCIETYFARFHERWQIVHPPVFDPTNDDIFVVSSVIVVGSLLRDDLCIRSSTIQVHQRLMAHLFRLFVVPSEEASSPSPWPFQTYQACIINIAFALESGNSRLIRTAARLFSLVLISLRENGVFDDKTVKHHQSKHYPGTFIPWLVIGLDRWSWTATLALKIDAYFALTTFQPPIVRPEEISLGLPSPFSRGNAYGLDVYFSREPKQPEDRQRATISAVAQSPQSLPLSGTLIEDVQLGLWGTLSRIWTWKLTQNAYTPPSPQALAERAHFEVQLDGWASELDRLFHIWNAPEQDPMASSFLLQAYSGKEEPSNEGWQGLVLARIGHHLFNTSMLYYCINLHLYADLRTIARNTTLPPQDADVNALLIQWASSEAGRNSMTYAISVLKTCEKTYAGDLSQNETFDPIVQICLINAALVARAWATCESRTCTCAILGTSVDIDLDDKGRRQLWIQNGGAITVDGIPICNCALEIWLARFRTVLGRGARVWELDEELKRVLLPAAGM